MQIGFEEVELVADVVALAVVNEAVQSLFAHERGHGIGELEFAAFAGFRVLQVMEDARAQDIAGTDREIRRSFLDLGFLDEDIGFDADLAAATTADREETNNVEAPVTNEPVGLENQPNEVAPQTSMAGLDAGAGSGVDSTPTDTGLTMAGNGGGGEQADRGA